MSPTRRGTYHGDEHGRLAGRRTPRPASRGDGGDQRYADGGRNAGVADHLHGVGAAVDGRRAARSAPDPGQEPGAGQDPAAAFSRCSGKGVDQRHRSGHERADTEIKGDHGRPWRHGRAYIHAGGQEGGLRNRGEGHGAVVGGRLQAAGAGHRGGAGVLRVKVDKTLVASVALHVVVLGWGLVSFSSKAFESTEIESVPVEFVTDDQLAKATAGIKSGKKENPKPLVEKVAEAKPNADAVGKITEKPAVVTDAAPDPV